MNEKFERPARNFHGRVVTDLCWNGAHYGMTQTKKDDAGNSYREHVGCTGWFMEGEKHAKDSRPCQCICHDEQDARVKRVPPISLPLPDFGRFEVK